MLGILRLEFYMKIQARAGKPYACIIDRAEKTQTFAKKRLDFSNTKSVDTLIIDRLLLTHVCVI